MNIFFEQVRVNCNQKTSAKNSAVLKEEENQIWFRTLIYLSVALGLNIRKLNVRICASLLMRKCAIISNHYLGHWPKNGFPLLAVRSIICLFIYIIVSQTKKIIKVMKCLNSKLFLDIITAHLFPTPLHYKMAQTEPIVTLFGFPDGANIGQQWANHLLASEPTTYTSRLRPFSLASYKVRYWSLSVL